MADLKAAGAPLARPPAGAIWSVSTHPTPEWLIVDATVRRCQGGWIGPVESQQGGQKVAKFATAL